MTLIFFLSQIHSCNIHFNSYGKQVWLTVVIYSTDKEPIDNRTGIFCITWTIFFIGSPFGSDDWIFPLPFLSHGNNDVYQLSSTINYQQLLTTINNYQQLSSTIINYWQQLLYTIIHYYPLLSTIIHYHPLSSTIKNQQLSRYLVA